MNYILKVENLTKKFKHPSSMFTVKPRDVYALRQINISLAQNEILAIVGETGCGKTTLAKIITGLTKPTEGSVFFNNINVFTKNKKEKSVIKKNMQMVFQDPFNSFNPRLKIFDSLKEGLIFHKIVKPACCKDKIKELLSLVSMPNEAMCKYPHEFSGGEKQRLAIARALSVHPKILVLDEPVSSLDITIQSRILKMLINLYKKFDISYIFISHDISVVKAISDRVMVMNNGSIIETGRPDEIFLNPKQDYTKELIANSV